MLAWLHARNQKIVMLDVVRRHMEHDIRHPLKSANAAAEYQWTPDQVGNYHLDIVGHSPSNEPGQAGALPELTDDMLTAGLGELFSYSEEYDDPREAVRRIYLAMMRAKSRSAGQPS